MKNSVYYFAFIFILSLFILLAGSGQALELDVAEDLQEFTTEWQIPPPEIELLRDPFTDYRSPEPEPAPAQPGVPDHLPDHPAEDETVSPPDFILQGVVTRRGDGTVILVQDGADVILLRPGETYEGFEFTHYEGNQAHFFKENRQFRLSPGGGVDER